MDRTEGLARAAVRRAMVRSIVGAAPRLLGLAAAAALVVVGLARLLESTHPVVDALSRSWVWVIVGSLLIAACWAIAAGWLGRPRPVQALAELDETLGLKDRLATSSLLRESDPFSQWAHQEAEAHLSMVDVNRTLPVRFSRSWAVWPAVSLAAIGAGLWLPGGLAADWLRSPQALAGLGTPELRSEAASQIASARQVSDPPLPHGAAPEGGKGDLLREIEEQLRSGRIGPDDARRQAAAELERRATGQEELARRERDAADALRRRLAEAGRQTSRAPGDMSRALSAGDAEALRRAAESLSAESPELSEAERAARAAELQSLAEQIARAEAEAPAATPGESGSSPVPNDVPPAAREKIADETDAGKIDEALRDAGLPPERAAEIAREVAERNARERDRKQAEERARDEARKLREALERAAEELRRPPPPRTNEAQPDRPRDGSRSEKGRDPAESKGEGRQADPSGAKGEGKQPDPSGAKGEGKQPDPSGAKGDGKQPDPSGAKGEGKQPDPSGAKGDGKGPDPAGPKGEGKQPDPSGAKGDGKQPDPSGAKGEGKQPDPSGAKGDGKQPDPSGAKGEGKQPDPSGAKGEGKQPDPSGAKGEGKQPDPSGAKGEGKQPDPSGAKGEGKQPDPSGAKDNAAPPSPGAGNEPGKAGTPRGPESPDPNSKPPANPPSSPSDPRNQPSSIPDKSAPAPGAPSPGTPPSGVDQLLEQARRMAEQGRAPQDAARRAEDMREQARRLMEQATPDQRRRMEEIARKMAENHPPGGRDDQGPDQPDRPDDRAAHGAKERLPLPATGDQRAGSEPGDPNAKAPPPDTSRDRQTHIIDARPKEPSAGEPGRVVGEWYSKDPQRWTSSERAEAARIIGEAAASGRKAVEDRAVPSRFDGLLRRYFRRLPEELGTTPPPSSDPVPARDAPRPGAARSTP